MTWDLICLKPQSHRSGSEEIYVFMHKSQRRSNKRGVNAVQFSVRLSPLPMTSAVPGKKELMVMEGASFHVVADLDCETVLFDIAKADSALPSLLRGGGSGSLAISELIIWSQKHYPHFKVALNKVSSVVLDYPNAKEQVTNCLQNFGFTVAQAGAGLQFEGNQAKALQIHINKAKVETANPPALYTEALQNQTKLAHQLHETQQDLTAANERVHQNAQSRPSSTPFYTGLAAGLVAGAALASIIFNI